METPLDPVSAISSGLDYLTSVQLPTGELPSFATPLGGEEDWQADSSVFVTALAVLALEPLAVQAEPILKKARVLLRSEARRGPLWKYWTSQHERVAEIPCDSDDTSCCHLALSEEHEQDGIQPVHRLLLANRDRRGAFYTWFVPHRGWRSTPALVRLALDEWRARARRMLFWEITEATPDDVDGVVNANVVRCMGDSAPQAAIEFVEHIVRSGTEATCDSWHRNAFTLWHSIATGAARGVRYSSEVLDLVQDHLVVELDRGLDHRDDLELGHALATLVLIGGPKPLVHQVSRRLLEVQGEDGAWRRTIFYFGGPAEVFGWGSEALTTAVAVGALQRAAEAGVLPAEMVLSAGGDEAQKAGPSKLWIEIDADSLTDHSTAVADLYDGSLGGILVRNAIDVTRLRQALKELESDGVGFQQHGEQTMYGTALIGSQPDRSDYFAAAGLINDRLEHLVGTPLLATVGDALQALAGGTPVVVPCEGSNSYVPATIRLLTPPSGVMHAHTGNEFCDVWPSYQHLHDIAELRDSLSWFVVLEETETGGDLEVYDLEWEETPAEIRAHPMGQERDDLVAQFSVNCVSPNVGDLILFAGGRLWHRVSPVAGQARRVTFGGFAARDRSKEQLFIWS